MPETFKLGELFCGAGGFACGALQASDKKGLFRIEPVWASDYNSDACATYRLNIHDDSVFCEDVRTLDINKLEPIDAFVYGFPCNSFSTVGKHQGLDNENFGDLYKYGIRILENFQPKWFVAENVSGLQSAGDGTHLKQILNDMEYAGYVLTPHLYRFEEYGVPQKRHRYIIVGIRKDLADSGVCFRIPSTDTFSEVDVSARTALSGIPETAANQEIKQLSKTVQERLSYIKPGQNCWTADMPEEYRLKTKTKISQIYRRLHPDEPSYTVTASGGGGTAMYHWSENRELTNRERARLQTFPDNFTFVGNYASVRKQIGMAVPPAGAKNIFDAVLDAFANI